jgi:hypothetical protein
MILSFKKRFVQKVLNGSKLNTIRADKGSRWAVGSIIHFWQGSPRNPIQEPYQFGLGKVTKVLPISVFPTQNKVILAGLPVVDLEAFAQADGFENWADMVKFFPIDFHGVIICWEKCEPVAPKTK